MLQIFELILLFPLIFSSPKTFKYRIKSTIKKKEKKKRWTGCCNSCSLGCRCCSFTESMPESAVYNFEVSPVTSSGASCSAWQGSRACHRWTTEGGSSSSYSGSAACASCCGTYLPMTFSLSSRFCCWDPRTIGNFLYIML